jgi:translation initiation factor IF-3
MTKFRSFKKDDSGLRINEEIRVAQVRLIDDDGNMLGVISTKQALEAAYEKGLDLIEVNPNSDPPVAKIIDYGKYKYELKKKQQEAKKKQVNIVIKEVQFRPNIDKHDFEFKVKHIERFIKEGDKVRVCVVFRGREMAHIDLGKELVERIKKATEEYSIVESEAKLEGKRMIMQLTGKK